MRNLQSFSLRPFTRCLTSLLVIAAAALCSFSKPGDLDRSFHPDGTLTAILPLVLNERVVGTMQSDGKMIVVGTGLTDFAVYRLNPDGSLDPTFGGYGLVTVSLGPRSDSPTAVAIQSDGKIVVAGFTHIESNFTNYAVIRLNPNGSLDQTFDGDGIQITDVATYDYATAVAIQDDGKILLGGRSNLLSGMSFTLVRYRADGSLDTSFSGDGVVTTQFPAGTSGIEDIRIQQDGKIVAAGNAGGADFSLYRFGLARYNVDGSLDTNFGTSGIAVVDVRTGSAQQNTANAVEIQPDGKIVAVGNSNSGFSSGFDIALIRLRTDGSLDPTFGTDGKVITPISLNEDTAESVAIQSDGKILVGGGCRCNTMSGRVIVRYNDDGTLDGRFGRFGVTQLLQTNDLASVSILQLREGGRIFTGSFTPTNAKYSQLLANGQRESDFDGDGVSDLAVRRPSNDTWYLKGSTGSFSTFRWGIEGDRMAPADYDADGKTDVAVFRPSNGVWYVYMSQTQTFQTFNWGQDGDLPVPPTGMRMEERTSCCFARQTIRGTHGTRTVR